MIGETTSHIYSQRYSTFKINFYENIKKASDAITLTVFSCFDKKPGHDKVIKEKVIFNTIIPV